MNEEFKNILTMSNRAQLDNIAYSVKNFGAKGDGVTDDKIAIQTAINTIPIGATLFFPVGKYYISAPIVINREINLLGIRGKSIIISDYTGGSELISISTTTPILTTTLNGALSNPIENIILTSTTGIQADDIIYILDNSRQWPNDPRSGCFYGELNVIKSVNTGTNSVELFASTASDYPSGVAVTVYRPIRDFSIEGLTIKRKTTGFNTNVGMAFVFTRNILIKDVIIDGFGGAAILDYKSVGNMYQNIYCSNLLLNGVGEGYGVQTGGSIHVQISDSLFHNCRRGVDFSGEVPSRFCSANDCEAVASRISGDTANGFGTHGTAQYCSFNNCRVVGGGNAFLIRGANIILDGCKSYGAGNSFACSGAGYGHTYINCETEQPYTADYQTPTFIAIVSPDVGKGLKEVLIKNCVARVSYYFIQFSATASPEEYSIENCKIFMRNQYFAQSDNRATAITFNLKVDATNVYKFDGSRLAIQLSAGTNTKFIISRMTSLSSYSRKEISKNGTPDYGLWNVGDICWNDTPVPAGYLGLVCTTAGYGGKTWLSNTRYEIGDIVFDVSANRVLQCSTAGTSSTVAPSTWTTVNDGTVVWTWIGYTVVFKGFGLIQA